MAAPAPGRGAGLAGALSRIRRARAAVARDMRRDLEAGRGFLWWPVGLGCGAAAYFALPAEPPLAIALLPAAMLVTAVVVVRLLRPAAPPLLLAAALVSSGILAGKLQVEAASGPVLSASRAYDLVGTVVAVEDRGNRGHRLRVRVENLEPRPREGVPGLVRLTLRGAADPPGPGSRIRVAARLGPPQAPVYPGGYDFGRVAFLAGIGGVGFALGPVEPAPDGGEDPPLELRATAAVERFRIAVSARIRETLPGDPGAIAAALVVGDRGAIDPATDEAMRISGLSHVLSISGLHMALVAACLFGGLRALMALWPRLALTVPIKQVAAAVALAGTLAYLVIAGMSLPTQRSAIMIAITLGAVILGRQPFSMRNVAVAALVVVALRPDAVLDPGAQMSFAAVAALIAGYEALAARRRPPADRGDVNPVVRLLWAVPVWIGLSMLTSLLAGIATAPIALHHFNRAAPLGLVANLLATPLVGFVIMPAGLAAALAMPFGLDGPPLAVMGAGIEGMLWIARVVADWTPAGGTLGRPALAGTLLVVAGGIWIALWTGRARLVGLPVLIAGLALMPAAARPDVVVAGDGRRALVVLEDRAILVGRPDTFETGIWLAALGDSRDPLDPTLAAGVRCDPEACVLRRPPPGGGPDRTVVAVVHRPQAFADECAEAALVVASIPAPDWCRRLATVIDVDDLAATGARTLRFGPPGAPAAEPQPTQAVSARPPQPEQAASAPIPQPPAQVASASIPQQRPQQVASAPVPQPPEQATSAPLPPQTADGASRRAEPAPPDRGTGWALVDLGRAIPDPRRPFHVGAP